MTQILRTTSLAATAAALALSATPALAVGPNQNATATREDRQAADADWVRDLDLGTIILSGAGTWSGATVGITAPASSPAPTPTSTCSGATQTAQYKITGTNNQDVTITAPNVTLTNQNDGVSTLADDGRQPRHGRSRQFGRFGPDFDLGGSITVASTTPDGTYTGTFNVTVNY